MNARLEELAREKELLLMRSTLCRLRLRRAAHEVRNSLHWKRMALAAAAAPAIQRIGFSLALSLVGLRLGARVVLLAGRILLVAKLARSILTYVRTPAIPAGCANEQTDAAIARSL